MLKQAMLAFDVLLAGWAREAAAENAAASVTPPPGRRSKSKSRRPEGEPAAEAKNANGPVSGRRTGTFLFQKGPAKKSR
jgi:hypothetical protein